MKKNEAKIGVFDSGLGGISVWKEIQAILPNESIIYFADQLNCPYGEKSPKEILDFSRKVSKFLIQEGAQVIVIACNTATSAAIDQLRIEYSLPFVGMEPAIKPAAIKTKSNKIGVIATKGTLESQRFQAMKSRYASDVNLMIQVGYGLVERVEEGKWQEAETRSLLEKYLLPMKQAGIDQLVLGCTHYPFLIPLMQEILGEEVTILNPTLAVARQTAKVWQEMNFPLRSENTLPEYHFYSSQARGSKMSELFAYLDLDVQAQFMPFKLDQSSKYS